MSRVEAHHDLMTQIRKNNLIFTKFRTAAEARRVRLIRSRRNEIISANRSQNPNSTDATTSSVTTNHDDSDEEDERTLASIVRGRSRSPTSRVATAAAGTSTNSHENSEDEDVNMEANRLIANLFSQPDDIAYDSPPSPEYNFSIEDPESDSDNEGEEDDSDNEEGVEEEEDEEYSVVVRSPAVLSDNSENHVDTEEAESE
jgi:hypothetical protein